MKRGLEKGDNNSLILTPNNFLNLRLAKKFSRSLDIKQSPSTVSSFLKTKMHTLCLREGSAAPEWEPGRVGEREELILKERGDRDAEKEESKGCRDEGT